MMISSLSFGGAERVATTLANCLADKGWDITIVTLASRDRDFYAVSPQVKRIPLNLAGESGGMLLGLCNNLSRVRALRRVLKCENPDVALGFMPGSNILCGIACAGTGIVVVGSEHIHPPMSPLGEPWRSLRRLVYPRLAAISAPTHETAGWIRTQTKARNVAVIPNPVPFPIPDGGHGHAIDPAEIKARLGGERVLLAVGRLAYQKAFDRLLAAFSVIHSTHPEWRLIILGEGPLREELERYRDEFGLSGAVALPGAVDNISAWYEASDAYVMTSRFEGFGNTLAEALAHGLPVVAVDCKAGPGSIVRDEVDGLLVSQDDPDALIAALERMMSDVELRRRCAVHAVEARERFAVERIARQWESLLNKCICESGVR